MKVLQFVGIAGVAAAATLGLAAPACGQDLSAEAQYEQWVAVQEMDRRCHYFEYFELGPLKRILNEASRDLPTSRAYVDNVFNDQLRETHFATLDTIRERARENVATIPCDQAVQDLEEARKPILRTVIMALSVALPRLQAANAEGPIMLTNAAIGHAQSVWGDDWQAEAESMNASLAAMSQEALVDALDIASGALMDLEVTLRVREGGLKLVSHPTLPDLFALQDLQSQQLRVDLVSNYVPARVHTASGPVEALRVAALGGDGRLRYWMVPPVDAAFGAVILVPDGTPESDETLDAGWRAHTATFTGEAEADCPLVICFAFPEAATAAIRAIPAEMEYPNVELYVAQQAAMPPPQNSAPAQRDYVNSALLAAVRGE